MKVSVYSTLWGAKTKHFDVAGALANWATFADEIVVAVPLSDTDDSASLLTGLAAEHGYPVHVVRTEFDLSGADPLAYGKTENAALQACTGTLLCQQNADEVMRVRRDRLEQLDATLQQRWDIRAFWVPTVDLYGSRQKALSQTKTKWYLHGRGLFRGACKQGIKPDGHVNYDVSSSDELLTVTGDLAPAAALLPPPHTFENLREYALQGWPISFHLGYLSLIDRIDRSREWREYWIRASGGDKNSHPTSIEELAARETVEHGLPLWPPVEL